MLVLQCKITFAFDDGSRTKTIEFDFVNEVEINKSRKNLTNTCTIKLPRKIKILEGGNINDVFKRGAKVTVQLGYEPEYRTEFVGYISKIDAQIPFTVFCEDEMWNLKQNNISKAFPAGTSLKQLIQGIYPGKSRTADLTIGAFNIKHQTTAQVLESLKKFRLRSYFESDGALVVDFASSLKAGKNEVIYDFSQNVIDNGLVFSSRDDVKIRVKGISKQHDGTVYEFFAGDVDGDMRTLNYVYLSRKDLEKIVTEELNQLKQDGLKNDITTFGKPYIEPGDVAILIDSEYSERNGSYLVDEVVTTFGVGGFRRKITIERKLA